LLEWAEGLPVSLALEADYSHRFQICSGEEGQLLPLEEVSARLAEISWANPAGKGSQTGSENPVVEE